MLNNEAQLLAHIQRPLLDIPGVVPFSRALSHTGEHALGWMACAAVGALADHDNRQNWVACGVAAFASHAASVVLKRVVQRPRPHAEDIVIGVSTPSKLSFPSSHATSTTAFAVLAGRITGLPVAPVLVPAIMASRLALGVHYPTDVTAGAVLGAATAQLVWTQRTSLPGGKK